MRAAILLLLASAAAFAQLDNDTITITALQPDPGQTYQASVSVCLAAEIGTGLDEVLAPLHGLGISERNLVSAGGVQGWYCPYTEPSEKPYVWWQFAYSAPLRTIQQTFATLAQTKASLRPGLYLAYAVERDWSAAPECAVPTLLSQARRHAENVAAAAGLRVGAVVALSDGTVDVSYGSVGASASALAAANMITTTVSVARCQVIAQFKLLR
jgi:hypothetical protein